MSKCVTYTGEWPDGSEIMVQRWLDDDGREVRVTAATKPSIKAGWGVRCWGPPIDITEDGWS